MSAEFIDNGVWKRLRQAAGKSKGGSLVAVAYFGKGAAKLLPLKKGSRLVVDASEAAVKCGQTCPADLIKLQEAGVQIFSVHNLHAKVFVFGRHAYIGSTNVSQHSANNLVEAVVRTAERDMVNAARAFILGLCHRELGPEALERLKKLYRPPKSPGTNRRKATSVANGQVRADFGGLRLQHLVRGDTPLGSESAEEQGKRAAAAKSGRRKTHDLDVFNMQNRSIERGQSIVQIVHELDGRRLVSPPGNVIYTRDWSNGRQFRRFVYLEVPRRRRINVTQLAKRLGGGAKRRLRYGGKVNEEFAERLRAVWQR